MFLPYVAIDDIWEGNQYLQKRGNAKKSALKVVDEILNNFGLRTNGQNFYTEYRAVEYYQEVKSEIEKL
jgi:hypothetical protein